MARKELEFIPIWYAALRAPIGVLLRTSDPAKARHLLYAARRAALDPGLDNLQILFSPLPEGDLVICHKGEIKAGASSEVLDE